MRWRSLSCELEALIFEEPDYTVLCIGKFPREKPQPWCANTCNGRWLYARICTQMYACVCACTYRAVQYI
uniref:Uncharacterized protein n=1 Tax=Anguilla anguilla TaxID=7936 RepID=A0A0E9TGR2_ANGAN